MKKLEIEKTKPTFIISVLKVDIINVALVFSISNFFINKIALANIWMSFSCSTCNYILIWDHPKVIYTKYSKPYTVAVKLITHDLIHDFHFTF